MNEYKNNICPCCPKGCDLSAPRCSIGEEYLKTGIIPEKEKRSHSHEKHAWADYEEMGIDGKIIVMLGKLGRMGHGVFDAKSSQNRILLSKTGSITQRELTEQLDIRPGSASEIIKKLESAGLITRQSNSEDRRTVNITLTDAGRARVEEINEKHGNANPAFFESLSEEEKQQLLVLLEKLAQSWKNRPHGEGRGEHKHCREADHEKKHDQKQGHHRGNKHDQSIDHGTVPAGRNCCVLHHREHHHRAEQEEE